MKKLIFISLLVTIAYCKAADPDAKWHQAIQRYPMQANTLNFSDTQIETIPDDLNLPRLEGLYLDNNQINAIPAGLNLSNLQELFLDNNHIEAIPDNLNLPQLRWLGLGNNQINAIPADLNLPQLQMLDLYNNHIEAIPANLNLSNLQELFLDSNQIDAIPADLNLPQLKRLILTDNYIDHIDPGIFERFPYLEDINLNGNPLTQENVEQLRAAATATGRNIEIIADEIGDQYLPKGHYIKGD